MEAGAFALIDESDIQMEFGALEKMKRLWGLLSLDRKCLPMTAIEKDPEVIHVDTLVAIDVVETNGPHKNPLGHIRATGKLLDLATDNIIDSFNHDPKVSFALVLLDDVHLVAANAEKVVRPLALTSYAPKHEPYTAI